MLNRPASRRDRQSAEDRTKSGSMSDRHRNSTVSERAAHAAAMRRHRRRERDGVIMVTIAVTPEQVAKLHALHYIGESGLEDRAAISAAIGALIDGIEIA
jgi:hypothetical protein